MNTQLLSDLTSKNTALETQLNLSPNSAENIDVYRKEKLELLRRINALADTAGENCDKTASRKEDCDKPSSSLLPVWKLGAEIASDIARTRVIHAAGDGFQKTAPYPVSSETRNICAEIYNTLIEKIASLDRMYMAPAFEKTDPGEEKRLATMRLHDLQHQQAQAKRQSANRSINRLFGSRG